MKNTKTNKIVFTSLMAALTLLSTIVFVIPIPGGFVHLGETCVLLSGLLLGPVYGPLAAGIGSMLADLILGYPITAVPTLVIKALVALVAVALAKKYSQGKLWKLTLLLIPAELVMVFGYFLTAILEYYILNGDAAQFSASLAYAISTIPMNLVQAAVGILITVLIYPVLKKILKKESLL